MSSRGLTPDVVLSVRLDAICGRHQFTRDPAPVVAEVTRLAGAKTTVRDETIGVWVGFFRDTHTAVLCDALLDAFPGARAVEYVGVRRRGGIHSTGDFTH